MSTVKVKGTIMRETELALLLVQGTGESRREIWIPRGQCSHISKTPLSEGWSATIQLRNVDPREIIRLAASLNGKAGTGRAKRRPKSHYKAMAAKRWEKA